MKAHLQKLIDLFTQKDLEGMLQLYAQSSSSENIDQLAFIYQQGIKSNSAFEFYQQIATKFVKSKDLSDELITQITSSAPLSFFTPALKLNDNFSRCDTSMRNVLHYLLAGSLLAGSLLAGGLLTGSLLAASDTDDSNSNSQPPFNYLRSMMLFESNEALSKALLQRDCNHLTPVEVYLRDNPNLMTLPDHEFSALLALIEIETKQQAVAENNYRDTVAALQRLCQQQNRAVTAELQRILLIAVYYGKTSTEVTDDLMLITTFHQVL